VNVSVCRAGDYEKFRENGDDFSFLGTRCELKNMNSMRFIQAAIMAEAKRQIGELENGRTIQQNTIAWNPDTGEISPLRSKEEAHDYRYFPDPDLLPLEIEQEWVDDIKANLPELPDAKKARFINDFKLSDYDASVLTADVQTAGYFEDVANGRDGKMSANWVINELFGRLKKDDKDITESPVSPAQLGGVIDLISSDAISGKIAKDLFEIVYTEGGDPAEIVEAKGMKQVTDLGPIQAALDEIIAANPDQVTKALENPKLAGWFVGQVMKATGGKANPKAVNELVAKTLKG
jgi:aspartyl-tRNA(Asn)/glutamyl-tRNA(Gln) amidotransferase subunit B